MHISRRSLLAGAGAMSALAPVSALAQSSEMIESAALLEDISVLEDAWTTLHPGLLRYNRPDDIDAIFGALRAWARHERSLSSAFLAFTRASARIKCGHTFPNPANQGRRVRERLLEGRTCVPFAFRWLGDEMVVTSAAVEAGLRPGDRVTAIDDAPVAAIARAMLPLMRADGSNDAKRRSLMEVRTADDSRLFDLYRSLIYPPRDLQTSVAFMRAGRANLRDMPLMTLAERDQALIERRDNPLGWSFAIADGIGVLTTPTWSAYNTDWDWRGFINISVDELIASGSRGLIFDLRGNEGGLDCGDVLLERLIERDVAPLPARRRTRYLRTPARLDPYLDTWDPSFKDWSDAAQGPDREGFYDLIRGDETDAPLRPRGARFSGPLIVLTDAANSSATFQFAWKVKQQRLGCLVGQVTGGSRRGINGGAYFFLRLPRSRIEIDLPLIGYFPTTAQPDEGVRPDIYVALNPSDVVQQRDHAMERAQALIERM